MKVKVIITIKVLVIFMIEQGLIIVEVEVMSIEGGGQG